MYRSILVPYDGSPLAEYAMPFALEIARRSGGQVKVVRAMPEPYLLPEMPLSLRRTIEVKARRELEAMADRWVKDGVPISMKLKTGFPVEEVLKESAGQDLIVLTTHGYSGLKAWILGSVAERLIEQAGLPVLAIHPPAKYTTAAARAAALRMFRDQLVPLDGSALARGAMKELKKISEEGTRIHLVRVVPNGATELDQDQADSELRMNGAAPEARGMKVVRSVICHNKPWEAISKEAVKSGTGLIVMSTHGETGLGRWLLGSVTERVIRCGPTPVLALRASRTLWKKGKRPKLAGAGA